MEYKILINKILKRQLSTAYEMIVKNSIKFDTNDSIKLLTYLCKVCNENLTTPECINKNDLCQLTLYAWRLIKNPSTTSIETYLRSIFYIVKLLLVKDNFDKIIELQETLIPAFLPAQLVDKQQEVYTAIWVTIYNKIARTTHVNDNLINNLLSLSLLLIEMYDRLDDRKQYLDNLYIFWLNLERLGVDWELLNQFYRGILANLTTTPNRFEIILKIYSTNFNNLLNHNRFDLILDFYKYFIRLFKKFDNIKELTLLQELLGIYKFLITNNSGNNRILQSCHKSLKTLHENYNSNNLQIVCNVLTSNIVLVTKLYVKNPENYWKLIGNQQYYKFLNDLSSIIAQCPYKCTCTDCCITTRIYDAFTISYTILQLGGLFLTKLDDCGDFIEQLLMYLEAILSFIVDLKNKNCVKWRKAWVDCGQLSYSIGKKLSEANNDNCLNFWKKLFKYLIELEGYNPSIVYNNYHTCCLMEIAKFYQFQKKDYEKSLTITAYNILISPQHRESLLINWVRYKANCRSLNVLNNQKIQELTFVKILEKYKCVIYYYDSNFQLTNNQKIELLQLELKAYKELWKSKIPMMVTFQELYQINNNNINNLIDIFIDIWGDGDIDMNEDLAKLIPTLIQKYRESVRSNNERLNLAHLHYLHQKYYLKEAIYKTAYDMNKTVIFNTQKTNDDPNDECDIVPSYEYLKLNRYNKIMKHLDKALDILSNLIEANDLIIYDRIYGLLKKIGHEYRLHSNLVQSIHTWYIALKIANCKNNDLEIMESTGFLIESIDIKQSKIIVQEFIDKADRIADNLDKNQYFNEIITYYLCKSLCYYNCDIDEAYRIFCDKIYGFCDKFDGNCLMKTRILLLHHKFSMLPCKYQIDGHPDLSKLHQAYKDVVHYYNTISKSGDTSYEMSIFFEITEQIVLLYHNLRMPRELRCYSKEIVILTQKLLLPYRTLFLLYYLAYADLLSSRLDDCKVKIIGLSYILCLQTELTSIKPQQLEEQQISKEIDRLTIEFNEIMLDVPSRPTTLKLNSPNSPNLQIESFKLPSFFYHQLECDCFQCVSVEFLEFILKKTHLELLLNVYQNNIVIARDYCCGALKIFDFICNRQERFLRKFTNKLPTSLLPNIVNLNLKTYSFILMEYGNVCLRANEIDKARRINQNLLVQLSNFQFTDQYLMLEILTQKLNISLSSTTTTIKDNKNDVKIEFLTVENTDDGPKTPESRQNPVTIPFKFTPATSPLPLPKNPIRTIQFDLDSDDDDDDDNNGNNNAMLKTTVYHELFPEEKTPAPSTSKNCCRYKTRSTVRRQNNNNNVEESNQVSSNNNDTNVIPMSPEAYTPNIKEKLQTNLANRTKLLTERLRSNKKENINNINTDNTVEQTKTVRKPTTRKLRYN